MHTIDELADMMGLKVSTIRLYQHRGLLPGPEMRGRVGYYGKLHESRLALIGRLQSEGYSLAGIAKLVEAWETGRGLVDLLDRAAPTTVTWEEFASLFPELAQDRMSLRRLEVLGALSQASDTELVLADDRLLRIGGALIGTGVPLTAVLDEAEHTAAATAELANRYVSLFETHIWQPFVDRGMPADELPDVLDRLQELRPLAVEAVAASMRLALDRAGEAALDRALATSAAPAAQDESDD